MLGTLLIIEFVADILLLPADVVLVPGEVILDLAVVLVPFFVGNRASGSGTRSIGSRRGAVRLSRSRRGVGGAIPALLAWLFLLALLAFQWWFSIHHPILTVLTVLFWIPFDLVVVLFALLLTYFAFTDSRRSASGREVRSG